MPREDALAPAVSCLQDGINHDERLAGHFHIILVEAMRDRAWFDALYAEHKPTRGRLTIARVLGADARHLFRLKMLEEWDDPELIDTLLVHVVTENERAILDHIRAVSGDADPALTDRLRTAIELAFDTSND